MGCAETTTRQKEKQLALSIRTSCRKYLVSAENHEFLLDGRWQDDNRMFCKAVSAKKREGRGSSRAEDYEFHLCVGYGIGVYVDPVVSYLRTIQ
jgi:hypothetical protein